MQKTTFFLSLIVCILLITASKPLKANKAVGGEIYWECTSNSNYIFYMDLYIECSGGAINTSPKQINVDGDSLPYDQSGTPISSISVNYLSSRDLTPFCSAPSNRRLNCSGDTWILPPKMKIASFKSDTITLIGTPAPWFFTANVQNSIYDTNLASYNSTVLLSAKMYNHPGVFHNSNALGCQDNSPRFIAPFKQFFSRGNSYNYSIAAKDEDADSIAYKLAPVNFFVQIMPTRFAHHAYVSGNYNFNSIFNIRYQDTFRLDPETGIIEAILPANPYLPYKEGIYVNYHLESYRNGVILASNYLTVPVHIFNFNHYNANLGSKSNNPQIGPPFMNNGMPSYHDSVFVGDLASVNVNVMDSTLVNGNLKQLSIHFLGENMATDYSQNGSCNNNLDTNCAYVVTNHTKQFNTQTNRWEFNSTGSFNGTIRWQTDCSDLDTSGLAKTHYFLIQANDQHCPIPGEASQVFKITVLPDPNNAPCNLATSLQARKVEHEVKVYPNPNQGEFFISIESLGDYSINIRNIQGQLVESTTLNRQGKTSLNLDAPAGVYFLELISSNGKKTVKKIVKR